MGIAALGFAVVYLFILVAGAVGALLVLVGLFREAPDASAGTGREAVGGSRGAARFGAGGVPPDSVRPGRSEDEAA